MVQETEKFRDEDETNELKYEVENGLEKFRVKRSQRSSRAVTDTDEDMVRILITDSQTKLNVARQLEPWSSIALTSFFG